MVSDNEEGSFCHSLNILQASTEQNNLHNSSHNNSQNEQHRIPCIHYPRATSTVTNATSSATNTQQDYNRQSYRVPQYYSSSFSYPDSRK